MLQDRRSHRRTSLSVLFLHALPLDGRMWNGLRDVHPEAAFAPNLYQLGNSIEEWAEAVLQLVPSERLIVVGCSVGGSCAIEVAQMAPDRVTAVVLMGTKADHRPDPDFCRTAIQLVESEGIAAAWSTYWAPLFAKKTHPNIVASARDIALSQQPDDIARGISVFHHRPDRGETVRNLDVPIAVISGADDVAPGVEYSARLAAEARKGTLHLVPSCGHYAPLEQPDAVRAILKDVIADALMQS